MDVLIEHDTSDALGVDVCVTLTLTDEEYIAVLKYNFHDIVLIKRPPILNERTEYESQPPYKDGTPRPSREVIYTDETNDDVKLDDFFGVELQSDDHAWYSVWHCEHAQEAIEFEDAAREGFKKIQLALARYVENEPEPLTANIVEPSLWFEHTHVIGESGGGKTQLLQTLFLQLRDQPHPPSFVIMDSQNQMLPLIKRKFPDAVMLDPEHNPPSLRLFDVRISERAHLSSVLDTFRFLFEAGEQPITGRQRTVFDRGVALMLFGYPKAFGRPAAIDDFEDFFSGTRGRTQYLSPRAAKAVAALPREEQTWYLTHYGGFAEACGQIQQRLENICGVYSPLRPLFDPRRPPLHIPDALNNILLINTNHAYLKRSGAAFFGRFMFKQLEQVMDARTSRSRPLFFMVDEVADYFGGSTNVLQPFIDQARKRNIACIFAHQRLSQLTTEELKASVTGVRVHFATNLNPKDLNPLAVEYKSTHDFMEAQQKGTGYADFAVFVRGWPTAKSYRLDFGQLEDRRDRHKKEEPKTEKPEPRGHDLHWTITIAPKTARDGGKVKVNSELEMTVPPNTTNGMVFRLKGKGVDGGHLYVKINVPPKDTRTIPPPSDDPTAPGTW